MREGYRTSFFSLCLACAQDLDSSYSVFGFEFHRYVPSTTVLCPLCVILFPLYVSVEGETGAVGIVLLVHKKIEVQHVVLVLCP